MGLFEINTVMQIAVLLLFLVALVLAMRFSNKKHTKRIAELREQLQKVEKAVKKTEEDGAASRKKLLAALEELEDFVKKNRPAGGSAK